MGQRKYEIEPTRLSFLGRFFFENMVLIFLLDEPTFVDIMEPTLFYMP